MHLGPIALFGSGETSPGAQKIHHVVMQRLAPPVRAVVLETPAGFEPNSADVAQKVADYLRQRLQNFAPAVSVVPARRCDGPFSTNDPALAEPIFHANFLFVGPGSPTYAARHLRDSYAWHSMLAQHRLGAAICFSSASTIAVSRHALPVYEIYKVGEDLHWQQGLDLFGAFGLNLVVIPHWNNHDGGAVVDTSHCYMGRARFEQLVAMLPPETTILGIEENTGVVIAPDEQTCEVVGAGSAVIVRNGQEVHFPSKTVFPVTELGPWRLPKPQDGIPAIVWQRAQQARDETQTQPIPIPEQVACLVAERELARRHRDWQRADELRTQIGGLGWQIVDTPAGPHLQQ